MRVTKGWQGLWTVLVAAAGARAQAATSGSSSGEAWNLHLQATTVTQEHFPFHSPYRGDNSLNPGREKRTSFTATIYLGIHLWEGGEVYLNQETQAGEGLSRTQGLAGYPNGEIYRVDTPKPKGSLARYYLRQVIGLGGTRTKVEDDQNQLPGQVDSRRLVLVAGKFSLSDFLDQNKYSHNPRTQFLNWSLMDSGAWDYAADTRGYTHGGMIELTFDDWSLRYAGVMEPKRANQMQLAWGDYPRKVRADNVELEHRHDIAGLPGAVRLLGFANHAGMGDYRQAIAGKAASGGVDLPSTRQPRVKYGFALNAEQQVRSDGDGMFLRASWNDGATETWAFTEIDRSLALGYAGKPLRWGRRDDGFGVAFVANGLAPAHRDYLAAGGYGFIIGDGRLSYQTENIAEAYYKLSLLSYLDLTPDFQMVWHPAYNRDRGPVPVVGLRFHAEI